MNRYACSPTKSNSSANNLLVYCTSLGLGADTWKIMVAKKTYEFNGFLFLAILFFLRIFWARPQLNLWWLVTDWLVYCAPPFFVRGISKRKGCPKTNGFVPFPDLRLRCFSLFFFLLSTLKIQFMMFGEKCVGLLCSVGFLFTKT